MKIENPSKQYYSNNRSVFSCYYHVIFCPKYRRKILIDPIDSQLKSIILDVAKQYQFIVHDLEVMPDHVHMIISCDPSFGIINCIKKLKGISARLLRSKNSKLSKKLPNLWTRSNFISTVGTVSLETVKQYIENQKGK